MQTDANLSVFSRYVRRGALQKSGHGIENVNLTAARHVHVDIYGTLGHLNAHLV